MQGSLEANNMATGAPGITYSRGTRLGTAGEHRKPSCNRVHRNQRTAREPRSKLLAAEVVVLLPLTQSAVEQSLSGGPSPSSVDNKNVIYIYIYYKYM